jgi:hypothetical protein
MWHILGIGEVHTAFWWGNLRERDHLEDLGIDEKIILKWILKTRLGGRGLGQSNLRQGQVADCCEHGNGPIFICCTCCMFLYFVYTAANTW